MSWVYKDGVYTYEIVYFWFGLEDKGFSRGGREGAAHGSFHLLVDTRE